MSKCIIILPYIENYTDEFIINECDNSEYIICADGGQSIAKKLGIIPNCVIGDFDSSNDSVIFNCKYITYPVEKDLTDGEACLLHAIDEGFSDICYLGGIGGRLDHMMGALALLVIGYKQNTNVTLKDMKNSVQIIDSSNEVIVKKDIYKYFSLYPVNTNIEIEYIKNAKYPLSQSTIMSKESTLCISNEINDEYSSIKLSSGLAYLIQSND